MLIKRGRVAAGLALLDRAMVAVDAGELIPEWAGNLYCHMIAACHGLADVRRAAHWTQALGTARGQLSFGLLCRPPRDATWWTILPGVVPPAEEA